MPVVRVACIVRVQGPIMFPQLGVPIPPSRDTPAEAAARKHLAKLSRTEILAAGSKSRAVSQTPPKNSDGSASAPFIPDQRWFPSAEGADHDLTMQLRKLRVHKHRPDQLAAQFQVYLQKADDAQRLRDAYRWEVLVELKVTLMLFRALCRPSAATE